LSCEFAWALTLVLQDKLEARNPVTNSSAVIAHAMMQCGTTSDTFLRDNLTWYGHIRIVS
jgi:hypothetical protein